jgi:hypothetical protein
MQAEEERKAKEAAEKERQRLLAEERKQGEDFLAKAQQHFSSGDLKNARELAERARGRMSSAAGDVAKVDRVLAAIADKEREVKLQQERERERQRLEIEAKAERERNVRLAESSVAKAKMALSSGDLLSAKKFVQEAGELFAKGGQGAAAALQEVQGLVKAKEEEEVRKEQQRIREEEARREARRQELIRQGDAVAKNCLQAAQIAMQVLKEWRETLADQDKLHSAVLEDVMATHAQAVERIVEADKLLVQARNLYSQANNNGGMLCSQAAGLCLEAHSQADWIASTVRQENARREMELVERRRMRELRIKKRKECPIPPPNLEATAGWGAGAVHPRASKRRDASMLSATLVSVPPSGTELHSTANLFRQIRTQLIATAKEPMDLRDSICETLAAYVQVNEACKPLCECSFQVYLHVVIALLIIYAVAGAYTWQKLNRMYQVQLNFFTHSERPCIIVCFLLSGKTLPQVLNVRPKLILRDT